MLFATKSTARKVALSAAISFAVALVCASAVPGLLDPDGFSHMAYSRRLWQSGFSLRGHPFLPFTMLADGVDPWWGFHLLLVPFLPLGDLWGARVAGACIAGLLAGTLAWLILRMSKGAAGDGRSPRGGASEGAWWLALAPLTSGIFLIRDGLARPGHLSTSLMLISLGAGAGFASPFAALGAGFVHGLSHLSAPVSPIFALLGCLGARNWKQGSRAVLWSVGGVGLALLVRPDRALLPAEGLLQTLLVFGKSLPHGSTEVGVRGPGFYFSETWPLLAALAVGLAAGIGRERCGSRPALFAAALAAIFSSAMTVGAVRFIDYAAPCLALLAALLMPVGPPRLRFGLAAAGALGFALLLPPRVQAAWNVGHHFYDEPAAFEKIARAVRATVPKGAIIFTDDAWVTEILISYLPEYRWLMAYDPVMLYAGSPQLFWRWHHAVGEAIECGGPVCAPARPSGAAIVRVLTEFDTRWAITSMQRGRPGMQDMMARDASRFDLVELASGQANGLYFWQVRANAGMH